MHRGSSFRAVRGSRQACARLGLLIAPVLLLAACGDGAWAVGDGGLAGDADSWDASGPLPDAGGCWSHQDCQAGHLCEGGECRPEATQSDGGPDASEPGPDAGTFLPDGALCSADAECEAGHFCECADATCATRKCNAVACTDCTFTGGGGGCGAGDIASGLDPNDACDFECNGSGACQVAHSEPCGSDSDCRTDYFCECADATCATRKCNAIECDCKYTGGWGGCGAGNIALGSDPSDACEVSCNGKGACLTGASTLKLRPEHVGVLWQNRTQQFTATRIFASGERLDVTREVVWSSSRPGVVEIDASGLATALVNHGILDIHASLPGSSPLLQTQTSLRVVNVTRWEPKSAFLGQPCPSHGRTIFDYDYGRVFLDKVVITPTAINWTWIRPDWELGGRLWWFWSIDEGVTYEAAAWDFVGMEVPSKVRHGNPLPAPWVGTMLSTICDGPSGFCDSGHERTNIYFTTLTQ